MKSLKSLVLEKGAHQPGDGLCVMEAVAYFAHEEHSDSPKCASPVIAAFLRRWNDDLDDAGRQKLKPYIKRVIGTNTGKADDEKRAWMATDWMVRTYLPAWLRIAKLEDQAVAVESLPEIESSASCRSARSTIDKARSASAAAWAAAWAAAGAAAWAAARDAAWDAAWDAAGDAARAAAWAAARDAAWDAAGDAARDAAKKELAPTVKNLQASAFDLLDRMIEVGR